MKKRFGLISGTISFVFILVFGVQLGIKQTVDYAVGEDAARKAIGWSNHLINELSDLPELLTTGVPSERQTKQIKAVSTIGDAFRFKLFDQSGNLVLISDEVTEKTILTTFGDHKEEASLVLETGTSQVSLNDGTQKHNRPNLYAEAYVPVKNAEGDVLGVVEVYLDQTATSNLFHRYFNLLAFALAAILILSFSIPYIAFLVKARQERRSREKADYLVEYDQVVNLLSRTGLMKHLKSRRNKRNSFPANASVIFLDVDHFKTINDTYGHAMGDAFLKHVGEAITKGLGPDDIAGRMGGDEFMIVAERNNQEEVEALAEEIQSFVSTPLRLQGTTVCGHISMGIYHGNGDCTSIENCMHKADVALYQAKVDGRNTHRTFSPAMEIQAARRRKVEVAILSGCEEDRFELYFQPLLHQQTKECAGFEALLRLNDKDGNLITPGEFIPVAEAMGEINRIGLWVLENALKTAADWPEHYTISINLSARQFDDNSLVGTVERLLKENGIKADKLELEVTESLLMENTDSVSSQLSALRALGVSIAMDDFGTGYSSLGYLWQFGFDKLKIDRSFIEGLENHCEKTREILDTIIMLGHRLGMTVTAEGIETEKQASTLSSLQCDYFQGFLYGKPMSSPNLAAYILEQHKGRITASRDEKESTSVPLEA